MACTCSWCRDVCRYPYQCCVMHPSPGATDVAPIIDVFAGAHPLNGFRIEMHELGDDRPDGDCAGPDDPIPAEPETIVYEPTGDDPFVHEESIWPELIAESPPDNPVHTDGLPGMPRPIPMCYEPDPPPEWAFLAMETAGGFADDVTIAVPGGVSDGDFLVLLVADSAAAPATITGWVLLRTEVLGAGAGQAAIYRRWADTEPASYTFPATGTATAAMYAYSGIPNTTPLNSASLAGTGDTPTAPAFTNGFADQPYLTAVGAQGTSAATDTIDHTLFGWAGTTGAGSWASARTGPGNDSADTASTTFAYLASNDIAGTFSALQSFLTFDTTAIDPGDVIDSVTLRLHAAAAAGQAGTITAEVGARDWGAAIADGIYVPGASLTDPILGTFDEGDLPDNAYFDVTLDPSAINAGGITKLYMWDQRQRTNSAPGEQNEMQLSVGEEGESPAQLVVEHHGCHAPWTADPAATDRGGACTPDDSEGGVAVQLQDQPSTDPGPTTGFTDGDVADEWAMFALLAATAEDLWVMRGFTFTPDPPDPCAFAAAQNVKLRVQYHYDTTLTFDPSTQGFLMALAGPGGRLAGTGTGGMGTLGDAYVGPLDGDAHELVWTLAGTFSPADVAAMVATLVFVEAGNDGVDHVFPCIDLVELSVDWVCTTTVPSPYWQCEAPCSVITVDALPAFWSLRIDGTTRVAVATDAEGGTHPGDPYLSGGDRIAFVWPDACCGALCVCVSGHGGTYGEGTPNTAADATYAITFADRYDL